MPRKLKPPEEKVEPLRGFATKGINYDKVRFRENLNKILGRCGFSQEDISHAESLAGRYRAEIRHPTKLDDVREGRNQLLTA